MKQSNEIKEVFEILKTHKLKLQKQLKEHLYPDSHNDNDKLTFHYKIIIDEINSITDDINEMLKSRTFHVKQKRKNKTHSRKLIGEALLAGASFAND